MTPSPSATSAAARGKRPRNTVPLAAVTVTWTVLTMWAGVTALIVLSLRTVKLGAAEPPNATTVTPLLKPRPVIVTVVPPAATPELGETDTTLGGTGGNMFGFTRIVPPLPTAQTRPDPRNATECSVLKVGLGAGTHVVPSVV